MNTPNQDNTTVNISALEAEGDLLKKLDNDLSEKNLEIENAYKEICAEVIDESQLSPSEYLKATRSQLVRIAELSQKQSKIKEEFLTHVKNKLAYSEKLQTLYNASLAEMKADLETHKVNIDEHKAVMQELKKNVELLELLKAEADEKNETIKAMTKKQTVTPPNKGKTTLNNQDAIIKSITDSVVLALKKSMEDLPLTEQTKEIAVGAGKMAAESVAKLILETLSVAIDRRTEA